MKDVPKSLLDVGGIDPIDSRLGGAPGTQTRWMSRRLALGLAATPMPAFVFLIAGWAVGDQGLGLLTAPVLRALEPATTAALVALGVLVGLDVDVFRRGGAHRLVAGAAIESGLAVLIVGIVFLALSQRPAWSWPSLVLLPWLLAVCAGSSATRDSGDTQSLSGRLGDLDDLLPILAGGLLLSFAAGASATDVAALFSTAVLLAIVVALAGALLVAETPSEGEQRVYAMGTLLLLTGVAAYLSASALLVGTLAGATWNLFPGTGREQLARDFRYLQHPVVVLVLVVAGARAAITWEAAALGGIFALARVGAKMLGGLLAARVVGGMTKRLGLGLLACGAGSVAFALNAYSAPATSGAGEPLLSIVFFGVILSDLLALLTSPPEVSA